MYHFKGRVPKHVMLFSFLPSFPFVLFHSRLHVGIRLTNQLQVAFFDKFIYYEQFILFFWAKNDKTQE